MDGAEGQDVAPATNEGVGSTDQPAGDTTATPPEAFDWSPYQDKNVAVTVQGQEQQVPFSELRDGYMRQSDYTQKTQQLSEHARQLQWASTIAQALENDPQQAIEILQRQYLADQPAEQEFQTDEERQIAELNDWRQQQEQQQAVQAVEAEMGQLQQAFPQGFFDPNELLNYAIEGNFPNLSSALQSMKFSEVYGEAQAVRDARAQQSAADEEARKAAQLVGGGHNMPPGSTQRGTPGERLSVREAWLRAQEKENQ